MYGTDCYPVTFNFGVILLLGAGCLLQRRVASARFKKIGYLAVM